MTESGPPTRNKRLAARFFKNPPQPHMCIQDYLQGSVQPCYVNVLSWDKITTANCPFDQLRLYGGMKITPPRTEKPMTTVFFVIANPEILRTNGKTASDPKEQGMLIELLLDFIEAMNKGVIFKRQYKILPDIFIIGELKLIWELVQNDRAKMQNELQQQSQLDDSNRKPVPQYPHYQNYQSHQDFQQKQQQQQQQQHHHLQQVQQQQHQQNNNESLVKPPQYQASNSHWQQHYQDNHANQEFNPSYYHSLLSIASNNNHRDDWLSKDQIPSSSSAIPGGGGGVVVAGGSGLVVDKNQQPILQQQQPNPCMYQYQQLSGQIYSYNVSKVHAKQNPNPPMSLPVVNNCGQVQYMSYNHFHPENNVYVKVHRMQQPQQPQIQLAHAPPQVNSMSIENFYKDQSKMIAPNYHHNLQQQHQHQQQQQQRSQLPEMSCNGSIGSLPSSSSSSSSSSQSNSPIRLLQRNASLENPTLYNNTKKIQVTDLDEDEPKDNPSTSCNKIDTNHTNAATTTTTTSSIDTGYYEIIKLPQSENSNNQIDNQQVNNDINNQGKMRILKRSKSLSDDKNGNRDIKIMKNCGDKSSDDDDDNKEKLNYDTEQDDDDNKCHEFVNQTEINKNGCAIKNNNTIDNFDNKQLIGTSCDVANCIVDNKSLINKPDNNNDDNDDKLTNAIAQMSIKDCTTNDAGEFHGVIS